MDRKNISCNIRASAKIMSKTKIIGRYSLGFSNLLFDVMKKIDLSDLNGLIYQLISWLDNYNNALNLFVNF